MEQSVVMGIDVSKKTLDCFTVSTSKSARYSNDEKGIKSLVAALRKSGVRKVVMESTSAYHKPAWRILDREGFDVSIVNARYISHFKKANGRLSKSDKIDAIIIAEYGQRMSPESTPYPDDLHCRFSDKVKRCRQLRDNMVAEQNRLKLPETTSEIYIEQHLKFLRGQFAEIQAELVKMIKENPILKRLDAQLRSMKGVGKILSQTIIAELPELGQYSNAKLAALAGLAPHPNDSGHFHGNRSVSGGRSNLRKVFYMAALAAIGSNAHMKALYTRLVQKGKAKKVAIVAVMRKMLITLNAMVKNGTDWVPLQQSDVPA